MNEEITMHYEFMPQKTSEFKPWIQDVFKKAKEMNDTIDPKKTMFIGIYCKAGKNRSVGSFGVVRQLMKKYSHPGISRRSMCAKRSGGEDVPATDAWSVMATTIFLLMILKLCCETSSKR